MTGFPRPHPLPFGLHSLPIMSYISSIHTLPMTDYIFFAIVAVTVILFLLRRPKPIEIVLVAYLVS
ncbi:hypothetical protein GQ43DRAFT_442621 [Delitschia confertaspora ATCC 74209]|uniref:Uncharacterized protein n=1 Tax=Delitschia confertaspora ATCC 74209 TaxID=1513339 RepID=A0A9P4JJK3_9PLEO|nr:hypothetical protein GQ43DRAFT_442621 [Delitschia confertaspora ATCC 74209]